LRCTRSGFDLLVTFTMFTTFTLRFFYAGLGLDRDLSATAGGNVESAQSVGIWQLALNALALDVHGARMPGARRQMLGCIQQQDRLQQHIRPVRTVFPAREFLRGMADAAHTRHEDHSH
jgi:hypothetical protein